MRFVHVVAHAWIDALLRLLRFSPRLLLEGERTGGDAPMPLAPAGSSGCCSDIRHPSEVHAETVSLEFEEFSSRVDFLSSSSSLGSLCGFCSRGANRR